MSRPLLPLLLITVPLMAGCDLLGLQPASVVAAQKEAEGKAVGGACRHAGRAIEDCYALNRKADKAAVFAGWREMNDYMRENKIDEVRPQLTAPAVAQNQRVEPEAASQEEEPAGKAEKSERPGKPGSSAGEKPSKGGEKAAGRHAAS